MNQEGSETRGERIIAGIDEAGLGPLLGPLTLGYSVFALPGPKTNLWDTLESIVARKPGRSEDRIIIADSKRVFARNSKGRARLETTAISFLAQRAVGPPLCGADLLRSVSPSLRPRASAVKRHPWYENLARQLPIWTDPGRLELRSESLRKQLLEEDIALVDAGVCVIPAGELNRSFRSTQNKSATVWVMLGGILSTLWEAHGERNPHVIVDRQGGRFRYGRHLQQLFPSARVRVALETPQLSEYQVEEQTPSGVVGRQMRLTFAEKAEDRAFSVALGSCLAKYARELCMEAFNGFFGGLMPELAPTAGYTTDGRRWVRDAEPMLRQQAIDPEVLIRQR